MEFATLQDVLDFAMEKEEASYRLYADAAARVKSISARKMLEEMAEEEAGHKRMIGRLDREKIARYRITEVHDLRIGDYLADIPFSEDMTFQEILIYSMKEEERSYRLYTSALSATDDPEIGKVLMMLATEEKRHKFYLESLYDDKILTEM